MVNDSWSPDQGLQIRGVQICARSRAPDSPPGQGHSVVFLDN